MKTLIASFSSQLREAIDIGQRAGLSPPGGGIQNVMITGLGGSGIGGTIVAELESSSASVPIVINKDYFLPAFAGPDTLVIVSSYSGNTEETLSAFEAAVSAGCRVVCVSSGGALIDRARAKGIDHIVIPGSMPPRACLAYSMTQLFFVLHHHGVIPDTFRQELEDAITLLDADEESIRKEAAAVAKSLHGFIPVVYAVAGNEGVAMRFRQQVNENAKMLCWHHVLPEMNHNELVGWTEQQPGLAVVFLHAAADYSRTRKRMEITREIVGKYAARVVDIEARGDSPLARALYHIHLCDWISAELADLKHIDAVEVKVIDYLKGSLAKTE